MNKKGGSLLKEMETRIVGNDVYLVVDLRERGTHFQLVHVEREMLNKSTAEEMEKRNLAEKLSARVFCGLAALSNSGFSYSPVNLTRRNTPLPMGRAIETVRMSGKVKKDYQFLRDPKNKL